jgi:hypothetical protein
MALPEIKRAEAERDLKKFCAEHVPPEYRDQIRHTYKIRGNDITLIERRPPWNRIGTEWTKLPIARFRYEPECNGWSVSWQRANGRWLYCDWIGETARFGEALEEVKRDPHGTFFG